MKSNNTYYNEIFSKIKMCFCLCSSTFTSILSSPEYMFIDGEFVYTSQFLAQAGETGHPRRISICNFTNFVFYCASATRYELNLIDSFDLTVYMLTAHCQFKFKFKFRTPSTRKHSRFIPVKPKQIWIKIISYIRTTELHWLW